jgi:hypothetical protein
MVGAVLLFWPEVAEVEERGLVTSIMTVSDPAGDQLIVPRPDWLNWPGWPG